MDSFTISIVVFILILVWLIFGEPLANLYDDWRKK